MPTILGANTLSSGYEVANSLRFNDGSSDYLSKTFGSAGNQQIMTISFWMKRSAISSTQRLISARVDGNNESTFFISSADKFYVSQTVGGATKCDIHTNRVFREIKLI